MAVAREARTHRIKYAVISASTIGDNSVVAAVPDKRIRVLSYALVCSAASTVRFESGAGGDALTGVMSVAANGGISCSFNDGGWFETAPGAALSLELSADGADGHLSYIEAV